MYTHPPLEPRSPRDLTPRNHPPASDPEGASETAPTDQKPALQGVSVLLVEDDVPSARLAGIVLNKAGAIVRFAHTAEEALIALESFHPRLIVLDLVLPKMGGLVFVQQLKADAATRSIVVVAVTSMNGSEAARVCLEAGCAAYIRKPIDIEHFAETLAQYLGAN